MVLDCVRCAKCGRVHGLSKGCEPISYNSVSENVGDFGRVSKMKNKKLKIGAKIWVYDEFLKEAVIRNIKPLPGMKVSKITYNREQGLFRDDQTVLSSRVWMRPDGKEDLIETLESDIEYLQNKVKELQND